MQGSGVKTFLILERLKRRKLDAVGGGRVIGLVAAQVDSCAGSGDKLVSVRKTV